MGGAHSGAGSKQKRKDNVDDKFKLIYSIREGTALQQINGIFSVTTFAGTMGLFAHIYEYISPSETMAEQAVALETVGGGEALGVVGLAGIVSISLLATKFCRLIPLRIYKHETK